MEAKPPLSKKHPNLFKSILLVAICNLVIAGFTFFDSPRASLSFTRISSIALVHQPAFWYTTFAVAGVLCLLGSITPKYQFARVGLVFSAAIGAFLALGFWLSYFTAVKSVGVSAPVIWTFYTLVCIINSNEPTVNPLSVVLQQDIHQTLSTEQHNEGLKNGRP